MELVLQLNTPAFTQEKVTPVATKWEAGWAQGPICPCYESNPAPSNP